MQTNFLLLRFSLSAFHRTCGLSYSRNAVGMIVMMMMMMIMMMMMMMMVTMITRTSSDMGWVRSFNEGPS